MSESKLHAFLTLALDGYKWSASCWSHFTPGEGAPTTYWIEVWVGPRASLDAEERENLLPLPGIEPHFLSHPVHSLVSIPASSPKFT
jgi:hypothetical protein